MRLLVGWSTGRSAARFEAATQEADKAQKELLMSMMSRNAETEYGRKYGFASIKSVEDYQRQVPIIAYGDIQTDMERVSEGARNVFTAEDPVMFAQTSGTTGKPKFIPVTKSSQGGAHADQMRTWISHALKKHPTIFDGKIMSLVSPAIEGHAPSGIPFGSTSGHIYKNMPWIMRRAYAIPYDVFEIDDYQAKYFALMRISLEQDVRMVATANPSSILKMCEKADELSEQIIRDIRDGTLSEEFAIEGRIRDSLKGMFKPNAGCAAGLEAMRSRRDGRLLPGDYWPRTALIGCWKGGTVGHYLDKFGDWFNPDGGTTPVRDWGFLASEARMSIPLFDEGSKGVLTVASNFFEFVPADIVAADPNDPTAWTCLTAEQVDVGGEYYILISTIDGLYRYDINDVVRIEGRYNNAPELVFLRKGRGMTNLTGEKVSVNQIIEVFRDASESTGAVADHFKAEADESNSRYLFRVEFGTKLDEAEQKRFLWELDDRLKNINIEYKAKRNSQRLGSPVMHVMREGWYERGRRQQALEGKRAFQAKTELLSAEKLQTQFIRPELEHVVEMD